MPTLDGSLGLARILVCLDGSPFGEAGVPYAAVIAQTTGAELLLLNVLDKADPDSLRPVDALSAEMARVEATAYLEKMANRLRAVGLPVRTQVIEGRAPDQILQVAERERASIVVLATHGERRATRFRLGGTTQKVVQHAHQSLLVARSDSHDPDCLDCRIQKVLVLLDGSQTAESSLPSTLELARGHGAEVIVGHALQRPTLTISTPPTRRDRDLLRQLQERNVELAHSYLRRVQSMLEGGGVSSRYVVTVVEDVRHGLVELIDREQPDLVVVAAHGQTSSRQATHGSVTQHLLAHAQKPIWVVQNLPTSSSHTAQSTSMTNVLGERLRGTSERATLHQ